MSSISLLEVRESLIEAGITGAHQSHSRANVLEKIAALVEGDPEGSFGLSGLDAYSVSEVLGFVAGIAGASADETITEGDDAIDPDKTIEGIVAAGRRLKAEADRGATLLAATGHPTGLLEHHMKVVDAYRAAGGKVLRLREEEKLTSLNNRPFEIRYNGSVGCFADWGSLRHTHSAEPMEKMLDGRPWPDIVLADHGFAGAAIERGIPAVAVMDVNDPALAVAAATGRDVVIIPMDDNRPPHCYEPSWLVIEAILEGRL
jgi:hypothetical protein